MCLYCFDFLSAGAKLDAFLAARGGGPRSFDRKLVLLRYHHRISAWDSLRYRWALLQVNVQHPSSDLFSFLCGGPELLYCLHVTRAAWQVLR